MSIEAVHRFRDALASGDTAAAIDTFDDVHATLSTQADRESALRDVARAVLAQVPPADPAHDAASNFVEAVFHARQARIEAKQDFALHLSGGPTAEAVAAKADRVIDSIDTVEARADDLRDAASGTDVSATPSIALSATSTVRAPKGTDLSFSGTVENVGLAAASDVEVTVSGYDVAVSPSTLDSIQPGEAQQIELAGAAAEAGESVVTIRAMNATAQSTIVVLSKADYVRQAIDLIEGLQSTLEELAERRGNGTGSGQGNGSGNGKNGSSSALPKGLSKKLGTAHSRLSTLESRLEDGRAKSPDEKLLSTAKLLGAFINQTSGLAPNQLSASAQAILEADAAQIVDVLHTATVAER